MLLKIALTLPKGPNPQGTGAKPLFSCQKNPCYTKTPQEEAQWKHTWEKVSQNRNKSANPLRA